MNRDELDHLLRSLRVPEATEEFREALPGSVFSAITRGEGAHKTRRLTLGFAAAAACGLLIGFLLWHRPLSYERQAAAMEDGRTLHDLLTRYPGRLQAIIQDATGLHTQVSDRGEVSTSNPVWLEIKDGSDQQVVVTFSGQRIRCEGHDVVVLTDTSGDVMLVGDGFFWSRGATVGVAGTVQIRAGKISQTRDHSPVSL